ncbi:hypothetical protein BpHYR1_013213 [Brachionus plicatilis]|uniref:Uncharacterized protein n=1 Tax=Brachionus plicatilis TaxID=10195 RepID=A0A3M7QLK5_BRAPC|nr:hypothetical protein BpHYR1_013213 [Brachionus plicatilis]
MIKIIKKHIFQKDKDVCRIRTRTLLNQYHSTYATILNGKKNLMTCLEIFNGLLVALICAKVSFIKRQTQHAFFHGK